MKEVVIKISPDGSEVSADALGFKGDGCTEVTDKLLRHLGTIKETKRKPEFNNRSAVTSKA